MFQFNNPRHLLVTMTNCLKIKDNKEDMGNVRLVIPTPNDFNINVPTCHQNLVLFIVEQYADKINVSSEGYSFLLTEDTLFSIQPYNQVEY